MAIVGDAFAKPMVRALEEAEADGKPYDLVVGAAHHLVGRDLVGRGEAGIDGTRANCFCLDSLGSSEGVGFANSMSTPGVGAGDREVHDRDAREGAARKTAPK